MCVVRNNGERRKERQDKDLRECVKGRELDSFSVLCAESSEQPQTSTDECEMGEADMFEKRLENIDKGEEKENEGRKHSGKGE